MGKKPRESFDENFGSFEKDIESPDKLIADEILQESGARVFTPSRAAQSPSPAGKIPAFVSLTRYKELRLALRDMRNISANMHRILGNLKANRDDGTELLDETVEGLQKMDGNIDKIKGVLRV